MTIAIMVLMTSIVGCKKSSKCVAYQSQYNSYKADVNNNPTAYNKSKLEEVVDGAKKHGCGKLD